jgi:hypothetical protein
LAKSVKSNAAFFQNTLEGQAKNKRKEKNLFQKDYDNLYKANFKGPKVVSENLGFFNKDTIDFEQDMETDNKNPPYFGKRMRKNAKDDDYKEQIKAVVFTNLLYQPIGDMTRYVRDIKPMVKDSETKYLDEYLEKSLKVVKQTVETLSESKEITPETIAAIRRDDKSKEELRQVTEIATTKVKAQQTRNLPLQNLAKAIVALKAIDMGVLNKLNENQQSDFVEKFNELKSICENIEENIHVS